MPNSAYVSEPKVSSGQKVNSHNKKGSSDTVEEILHQLIGRYFMLLLKRIYSFVHPRWLVLGFFSINSTSLSLGRRYINMSNLRRDVAGG